MNEFPDNELNFLIPGPAGSLELLTTPSPENLQHPAVGIICHPHPLYGGTMNNKVVTTIARVFRDLGLRTIRFNFRGIGKSEGSFAEGKGELEDLLAVIEWARMSCQRKLASREENLPLWLGGFSFGAAVSAYAATKIKLEQLVSVAPPVPRFDLTGLPPITCPWIVVQGEKDEVVEPQAVYDWVDSLNPKPQLIRIPDASHFFHGKLLVLREILEKNLKFMHSLS